MGTWNWNKITFTYTDDITYTYFYIEPSNKAIGERNIVTINYTTIKPIWPTSLATDKIIFGDGNANIIYISNHSITDANTLKESLQGQILYYELETPIEVILDNIDLSYEAWDFGTEELLSDVATTPIITETQYNFNAVDMIRNNYFAIKALKEADPLNDLADVAFSGDYNDLENKPESIKNPTALSITKGSTTTNYDGSEAKTVSIPTKTSELTKDDVYSKTEVYTQREVNNLINAIEGVVGGIVNTWRPITIQNNSGNSILSLGEGATSGDLTLKAGNNITFTNTNGVVTIGSTYSYTLPAANTTLGGIKTGGDLTLTNGIATVNDLSTISNNASRGLEAYNWGNHADAGYTKNTGTVTSVDINVPTGLSITGSPITSAGTLNISLTDGYSIPTIAKQSNWDQAYNWGNHANKYLPLTGGTLSGNLTLSGDSPFIIRNVKFHYTSSWARAMCSLQVDNVDKFTIGAYGQYTVNANNNGIQYVYIGCDGYSGLNLRISPTELKWGDNPILHKGNYTSYINETNFPGINKTGTYNKPTTGIPKSDLELSVQTSLGKADTALQSYTEQYRGTVTGIQMNGGIFAPTDGIVNLGTVITAHQSLAAYAKLDSPTFTGTPKAPTATAGTNNTQIATTAFVKTAIDNKTSIAYATEAGKVTKALKFGTKTYNGSSEQTITAADLGLEAALKYCGITTTQLYDGSTTNPIVIDNKNHTAVAGCTVFYNSKEFVFNGSKWEEIGDESSFKVKQTAVSSPTANGSATAFIDTISQDTNGNITVTKKNVSFPTIPTSFNIGVNLTDDNIVNLTGNGGANSVTIAATHAEKGPSSGYVSGNTTTSVSGYGDSKTIKIPQITVDKYGHVTAAVDESVTITMPSAQTIPTLSGGVASGINKILSGITVSGHTITPTQKTLKGTGKVSINDDGSTITINGSDDTYTGTVKSITAGTGLLGGTITESGTISLATVGTIAGNFGLSTNTNPGYAGTFKIPYITVDNYGRVTAINEKTVTMPSAQSIPSYSAGAGLTLNANNVFKTNVPRISNNSKATPGLNTFVVEEYTSNSPNLPTAHYYHIYTAEGPDSNYATQLALGMTTNAAYYRVYNNGSWRNWNSLINTDTHHVTRLYVGESDTASNTDTRDPYLKVTDDNTYRNQIQIKGTGNTSVVSSPNGVITISSSDTYTGTVTSVKVGSTSYSPSSGIVSLPAYPTTLPASDVYAWAKATTKPSYSWNEITNKPTIPSVGNATITIKQNGTTIGSFTTNQTNNTTITLPNTGTYGVGTPGNPGLAEPAGATSDTGFILNNHAECYHAVQINGDGKLVVNIPNKYFVAKEKLTNIEIGSSQKIVYQCYESETTINLSAKGYNTSTHLYFVNGTSDKITLYLRNIHFGADYFVINSELSIDFYVTEAGDIIAEPIRID